MSDRLQILQFCCFSLRLAGNDGWVFDRRGHTLVCEDVTVKSRCAVPRRTTRLVFGWVLLFCTRTHRSTHVLAATHTQSSLTHFRCSCVSILPASELRLGKIGGTRGRWSMDARTQTVTQCPCLFCVFTLLAVLCAAPISHGKDRDCECHHVGGCPNIAGRTPMKSHESENGAPILVHVFSSGFRRSGVEAYSSAHRQRRVSRFRQGRARDLGRTAVQKHLVQRAKFPGVTWHEKKSNTKETERLNASLVQSRAEQDGTR